MIRHSVDVERKLSDDLWMNRQIARVVATYGIDVLLYDLNYAVISHQSS